MSPCAIGDFGQCQVVVVCIDFALKCQYMEVLQHANSSACRWLVQRGRKQLVADQLLQAAASQVCLVTAAEPQNVWVVEKDGSEQGMTLVAS